MDRTVVLASAVRTPIGAFDGSLASSSAPSLGAAAIAAAVRRSEIDAHQVNDVFFGNVVSAGLGQNVARQCALGAGLAESIGATTVNKVCGSGLQAVILASRAIQCGDAAVVVAGGTENMSRAPYLLDRARNGYRLGHGQLIDAVIRDGLWDVYNDLHMGTCGDACAKEFGFSREAQDDFAIASFQRAIAALADGAFADEIIPVTVAAGKTTTVVSEDENPKKFNEGKLRQLRPAFGKDGTVTAGNASSINDGAAALVVASAEHAARTGVKPLAKIIGYAGAARAPREFTTAPISAIRRLLEKMDLRIDDIDLFEINEAFAVVTMAAMKELSISHDRVNVNGGAIALGHPIGCSGARTLVTLIHALRNRNLKRGVVAICIGGGEALAMAIELL